VAAHRPAVHAVVGGHDRADLGFDRRTERREVELPERALAHADVGRIAVGLVVVRDEVFRDGTDAGRLDSLDDAACKARSEVWVLAEALEEPSGRRGSGEVAVRREQYIDASRRGLPAHGPSCVRASAGSQAAAREIEAGNAVVAGLLPLFPSLLSAPARGDRAADRATTPSGPSAKRSAGTPRRSTPGR
jgi:hypothetical protein